jgi:hypothetical protein
MLDPAVMLADYNKRSNIELSSIHTNMSRIYQGKAPAFSSLNLDIQGSCRVNELGLRFLNHQGILVGLRKLGRLFNCWFEQTSWAFGRGPAMMAQKAHITGGGETSGSE